MLWSWRSHRKKTWQSARKSAATCSCWIGIELNIEPKAKGTWVAGAASVDLCWSYPHACFQVQSLEVASCLRLLWFAHPGRYLTAARVDLESTVELIIQFAVYCFVSQLGNHFLNDCRIANSGSLRHLGLEILVSYCLCWSSFSLPWTKSRTRSCFVK